ncbi:MAG: hypothetical protein AAGJ93_06625 [Bacteroidota bacterium]
MKLPSILSTRTKQHLWALWLLLSRRVLLIAGGILMLTSCKTIDLRTDYALQTNSVADAQKGKELLEATYYKMGYDKLETIKTYEVNSYFDWRTIWSIMPMNALPGNKSNDIRFRFATNTFDGQVTFLEGRKTGKTYGLQSWTGYDFKGGEMPEVNNNDRYAWGLPTYHYVIEAPMRLLKADIIRYAGQREVNGKQYDLVYVTWGKDAPHKEHDQWLVYIN